MILFKDEKSLSSLFIAFFLGLSLLIVSFSMGASESPDRTAARLVEAAKSEGTMVLYTVFTINDATGILQGFRNKYPFIKTVLYRTGGEKLLIRILAEERAKKYTADAVLDSYSAPIVVKNGLAMKYVSPESKVYPKEFKDPQGFWTAALMTTRVLGYNTKLVDPQQAPRRYEDLLDPKWYGKMGMAEDPEWVFAQLKHLGKDKGIEFMKNLARQKVQILSDRSLIPQMLAAGEFSIAVTINGHGVEQLKRQGAPVEWVAIEPVPNLITPTLALAHAPHPNAARLFVDFILSKDGQTYIRKLGRITLHPEVLPDPPRLIQGLKLMPPDPVMAEQAEENTRLFNDIFRKSAGR